MEQRLIDARGLACPLPVVNAKQAAESLQEEGVITVLVDNEIAVQNLQKFAAQRGHGISAKQNDPTTYEVHLHVTPGKPSAASFENETSAAAKDCVKDQRSAGLLVVLSAKTVGTGDEKLGTTLMKSFLFALTKQDVLPECILCYNGGAFLTTESSEVLEDLKLLDAEGVKIMTCGTCLDFYGLKEQLAVGTVTNMYDIVETMERAGKIIKP